MPTVLSAVKPNRSSDDGAGSVQTAEVLTPLRDIEPALPMLVLFDIWPSFERIYEIPNRK